MEGNAGLCADAEIDVNSTNREAIEIEGNATVNARDIRIVGNYSVEGSALLNASHISTGAAATADPLRNLQAPDPASLATQSPTTLAITGGDVTLAPGVYVGGIAISGSARVTFSPGIYYLQSGSLSVSDNASAIGTGMMFYVAGGDSSASIRLSTSGVFHISPPSSGAYAGISFFQSQASPTPIAIVGGSNLEISGVVYAAAAEVKIAGHSDAQIGSQFIVHALRINGSGNFLLHAGSTPTYGCSDSE